MTEQKSTTYVTLTCPACGEKFRRHKSNSDGVRYCSYECQRGMHNSVDLSDREKRSNNSNRHAALRRDNYRCQECGCEVGSSYSDRPTAAVHHKVPLSQGGTNDVSNLVTLCKSCHSSEHLSTTEGGHYWIDE